VVDLSSVTKTRNMNKKKISPKLKSVDRFSEYNSMIVRHEYRKATSFQNLVDIVIYV